MASLLNMSGGSLLGKRLPYDAEIEYLESSGTQWIDLGFPPTNNTVVKIKFMNLRRTGDVIFGMYSGSDYISYRFFNAQDGGGHAYFDACGRLLTSIIIVNPNNIYEIELGNKYIKDLSTDIIEYGTVYNYTFNVNLTLNNYGGRSFSNNRWYYVKIFNIEDIILDFIPVRIGNVGYMYDKVSGQLFGNQGTGDFILGPDKTN